MTDRAQPFVHGFGEGSRHLADLLGEKGANLAEMTKLGLRVPPGFTITTAACQVYVRTGSIPAELPGRVRTQLGNVEEATAKRLGDPVDPLLVSVRPGARLSMPGRTETILNVGLNDRSVGGLARQAGGDAEAWRFAWDSYRRLIQMLTRAVCGVTEESLERELAVALGWRGKTDIAPLDAQELRRVVAAYQDIFVRRTGLDFPQDPYEQLDLAIRAAFDSWNGSRARLYRRQHGMPDDLGCAVNVMAMVFGTMPGVSGAGVAFTRDPVDGGNGFYGCYRANERGEDIDADWLGSVPLDQIDHIDSAILAQLVRVLEVLETHYQDLCEVEFVVERRRLWVLQTSIGRRTAAAAFVIVTQLVDEGRIDLDEALRRVTGIQLAHTMVPSFDLRSAPRPIAQGIAGSFGAAVGTAVFDARRAIQARFAGDPVILVRPEVDLDDLPAVLVVDGILTARGGRMSDAATVARGLGTPCVCGVEELDVKPAARRFTLDGVVVDEGDVISIDGTTGSVYKGTLPVRPSAVVHYLEGRSHPNATPLVSAVHRLLTHADTRRRLRVRANADTAKDAAHARRLGAEGIGLCRTESVLLGDGRRLMEALTLASTPDERQAVLDDLRPLQRDMFETIFRAMDGLPVAIRLLDSPLHDFVPSLVELTAAVCAAEATGADPGHDGVLLAAARRLHEENPALGVRGVRQGLVVSGLFEMQIRGLAEAAAAVRAAGIDVRPEIIVPLVGTVQEMEVVKKEVLDVLAEFARETGTSVDVQVGAMIEVPRAALTSGRIAEAAEFFSFGTNDLTQLGWGLSREDATEPFLSRYCELGIFGVSPFESIDRDGVGRLIDIAVREGRATRPDLSVGVCGDHCGDPDSIHAFHASDVDYLSCAPFWVPAARLEAGRAAAGVEESHAG